MRRKSDGNVFDTERAGYWNGASGFSADRVTWFDTNGAVGNTAGDIDGDGLTDIIFNSTMRGHIRGINNYIYLSNKDGKYGTEHRIDLPTDGSDKCGFADLDLDGYPEVIFSETERTATGRNSFIRIYP